MTKKKIEPKPKKKAKSKPKPFPISLPLIETEEAKQPKDFTEIGGSPVPGITLRQVLRGHTDVINRITWSPDGKYLASPSLDHTIRIWDARTGECIRILRGLIDTVYSMAWSPDGQTIALGTSTGIKIRNTRIWTEETLYHHKNLISSLAWSPDGNILASGSLNKSIRIWDRKTEKNYDISNNVADEVAWSLDGSKLALSYEDRSIGIYNLSKKNVESKLKGHSDVITDIKWMPDNIHIISSSYDNTIRLWNTQSKQLINILEGHTDTVNCVSISADNLLFASKAWDGVRLWRIDTWQTVAVIGESGTWGWAPGLAFHPSQACLATLGESNNIIRIWDIDYDILIGNAPTTESIRYTTAKLVLVGDSGVGKTGLGWRLAHGEFKEHASTHGQQFWSIPALGLERKDGTECEAVLWDLAGQHVYRQIHSIFLENVAAALVLFDPTNRQEPLKGAQFWLEQLKGKGQLPPAVLVGARVDRGAPVLSQDELDQFCQRYGIKGGYISTSALKGKGLNELLDILKAQIPWDEMTATVTTVTFKRIKDYVLSLKANTDRKGVLVNPMELRGLLEASGLAKDERQKLKGKREKMNKQERKTKGTSPVLRPSSTAASWQFTDAEMMTAVGHLDTHGFVTILCNLAGEQTILLTPELLANLVASIMLLADKNPRDLGAVSETELLQSKYSFDELNGLENIEQQTLLDAAILRLLEHNICFRETFNKDTLLIFPSLIKQKRPLRDDLPATDDISYVVRGRVENLYASLVVLLGYTRSFTRINQWQNQAQYEMEAGQVCGFRSIEEREGEIELVLYYGDKMPKNGRDKFQELLEQFLYQRDVEVTRFPPVICKNGHQQKRVTIIERVREGRIFVFCDECGEKTALPDFNKPQSIGIGASPWLQREEATARLRSSYEKHLTNIKSYRRSWATPRAYLSHLSEQNQWAEKMVHDLSDAGIYIVEKAKDLKAEDFAIVLDTPAYRKAYQVSSSMLGDDLGLIQKRLSSGNRKILSLSYEGKGGKHHIQLCTPGDFCDETHYSVSLFNLVLELYAIPLDHAGFAPLRQSLHKQWEQTLAILPSTLKEDENMEKTTAQNKKRFDVALSFPGEYRKQVSAIAKNLSKALGKGHVFYDKYYEAELARPDLDTYIQSIYHDQSELIVVFLCAEYEKKEWCGLEWRAVRDLLKKKETAAIMSMRFDNTHIPGLFSIDGYIDIANRDLDEVSQLILQRLEINRKT